MLRLLSVIGIVFGAVAEVLEFLCIMLVFAMLVVKVQKSEISPSEDMHCELKRSAKSGSSKAFGFKNVQG